MFQLSKNTFVDDGKITQINFEGNTRCTVSGTDFV